MVLTIITMNRVLVAVKTCERVAQFGWARSVVMIDFYKNHAYSYHEPSGVDQTDRHVAYGATLKGERPENARTDMRVATIHTADGTRAVRIEGDNLSVLSFSDVAALLSTGRDWRDVAAGALSEGTLDIGEVHFAPVVPRPEKILCAGLNYRAHAREAKMDLPTHPVLFAKFWRCLIGARDDLVLPSNTDAVDWEAELGLVIGTEIRRGNATQAKDAIAGYTVINDVSMRDWQRRTREMLQGKAWEASTPVGPALVTGDEIGDALDLAITCEVDGAVVQNSRTSDLVFSAVEIVEYISQFITLVPGDVIATGTPSGVGGGRKPPVYLSDGQVMRTRVEGIGELVNVCRSETTV